MKWLIVLLLVAVATVKGGIVPSEGDAANSVAADSTPEQEQETYPESTCEQHAREAAFQRARVTYREFGQCIEGVIQNMSLESIDEAMVNDNLPDILKSYCSQAQDAKYCFSNFTSGMVECMTQEQREAFDFAYNRLFPAPIDYLCFEDGRRMVTFLTAGGRDCWMSKKLAAKQCIPVEFDRLFAEEMGQRFMRATPEDCRSVREIEDCIVKLMQSCPESTPALEIKGLLDHMYGVLPCCNHSQVDTNGEGLSRLHLH